MEGNSQLATRNLEPEGGVVDVVVLPGGPEADWQAAEAALEQFTDMPFWKVVVDPGEEGAAGALNRSLEGLQGAYVALLREDVVVTEGWLSHLVDHLRADEGIAMIGSRTPVGSDAQRVKARYKSTKNELQKFARRLYQREKGQREEVQALDGACVVIRTDVLRALGGFDAGFRTEAFLDDFARRCRQLGLRVVCGRDTFVHCSDGGGAGEPAERERRAVERLEAGDGHRAAGESEAAIACYREALEAKEDYLEATLVLSAALLEEERGGEAVALFRKLAERHPDSSRVKNYLGRCLYQAGEVAEGRRCFEEALEMDPEFSEAHSNLGVLLWENGELDGALEHLNRAAELAPDDPDVIYNIGMVYAQLGQVQQAMEMLKHYLVSRPEDLNARVYLSVLFLENGAESEGLTELEHVLAEDPDHGEALKVVAKLQEAVDEGEDGDVSA